MLLYKSFFSIALLVLNACSYMLATAPPAKPGSGIPVLSQASVALNPEKKEEETETAPNPEHTTDWGFVRCNNNEKSVEAFNTNVRNFLKVYVSSQNWYVKCVHKHKGYEHWKGGFFFKGKISLDKILDPYAIDQSLGTIPKSTSFLELHFTEAHAARLITKIPLKMELITQSANISPSGVRLLFQDGLSTVVMEGRIGRIDENNKISLFSGTMGFVSKNITNQQNPNQTSRGSLGAFQIPTCSFFECK